MKTITETDSHTWIAPTANGGTFTSVCANIMRTRFAQEHGPSEPAIWVPRTWRGLQEARALARGGRDLIDHSTDALALARIRAGETFPTPEAAATVFARAIGYESGRSHLRVVHEGRFLTRGLSENPESPISRWITVFRVNDRWTADYATSDEVERYHSPKASLARAHEDSPVHEPECGFCEDDAGNDCGHCGRGRQ